jgi:low affinity Fe/Cu permease
MDDLFHKIAVKISSKAGTPKAFLLAISVIFFWAVNGPIFNFSNTWQLVINTTTTIVTFLMVFIIQNTQNRDAKATQLKLDELIRSSRSARNEFVDLEDLSDKELEDLANDFKKVHDQATSRIIHELNAKVSEEHHRRGFRSGR